MERHTGTYRSRMAWRLIVDDPLPAAENMAIDEALLDRARATGDSALRVYGWSTPALSLGRNQPARGRYILERADALGVTFVRRPTGGRAVLHCREITYSVTAPVGGLGSLAESYARINRLLVGAFERLGVPAKIAPPAAATPPPGVAPCFETPVAGEIVAQGRKLVGSAQLRDGGAILQHGSILVDDDQALASELLVDPLPAVAPPATLRALLGRAPPAYEVAGALLEAVRALEDPQAVWSTLDADTRCVAATRRGRYLDPEWTWRL
jgi:lipoyl(octanoyl) transferase